VLDLLQKTPTARTRQTMIHALCLSPGDQHWLMRARAAIIDLQKSLPKDAKLAQNVKWATRWLDSRLKNDKSKTIANKALESDSE